MDKAKKQEIIKEYAINENDVGSADVQIAVLSTRISEITEHLKIHKKDHHSRRGLIAMVNKRRKLMQYLAKKDINRYEALVKKLGIRVKI
jgi:small subunit ribosomal protein S15